MIIFIDESGIHKQIDHSTIVLVYVMFEDVENFDQRILEIERELKIKPFHWKEQRWKIKSEFLSKIVKLPFKIKIAIFRNPINLSKEMENVFQHLIIEKKIRKIIIEGRKPIN